MTSKGKLSISGLKDVPETLFYPLMSRYVETKKEGGVIHDPKSVEILDGLDFDADSTKLFTISRLGVCLRTIIFDEYVSEFIKKNPDGVVINLGCGLDTRFQRVDNGKVHWFDLDLPETIELRKHFFEETDRFKFISKSVLDPSWAEEIPQGKKAFFIMEGLAYYFEEREVKEMLSIIVDNFPGAELAMEAFHPFYIKMTPKMGSKDPLDKKVTGLLKWGIKSGAEIEDWFDGVRFVEEQYVINKRREAFPLVNRIFFTLLPFLTKATKVIRLNFG
ncbi:MAG: class I SAM-dependent methyltransferase [Proteobacteria bacterium]|nr:class I SAM-dependent methyltransferase [Pseudomonadota bacterium]